MIEKARVIDTKDNYAKVEIKRVSACGESCASCKGGCAPTNTYVEAKNNIGAKSGDLVEIEMSTKIFLSTVAITYGLPLIMLIVGIFSGSALVDGMALRINRDLAGTLLGFVLMALAYLYISLQDKKLNKQGKITFEIIKIL